jgi:hypothetical protein
MYYSNIVIMMGTEINFVVVVVVALISVREEAGDINCEIELCTVLVASQPTQDLFICRACYLAR